MNKTRLRKYANLIARCGVNVQKGQEVIVMAELDQPEFVKMVVDECYKLGAKKVSVDWSYQPLTKSNVRYCKEAVLGSLDEWQIKKWEHQVEVRICNGKALKDHQAHKSEDGKPLSVVHRRSSRQGMGKEDLPRRARKRCYGEALGGYSLHLES